MRKKTLLAFLLTLALIITSSALLLPAYASESLIWQGYVLSSGVEVTGPVLYAGTTYRIVAVDRWWYAKPPDNLAADAEYYTTDWSDSWNWTNHFRVDSHSFLQINEQDVEWGPFSNGDTGHTYTIEYTGQGTALKFRIFDWVDGNYTNNQCKLLVSIYEETTTVGGHIIDSNPFSTAALWVTVASVTVAFVIALATISRRKTD